MTSLPILFVAPPSLCSTFSDLSAQTWDALEEAATLRAPFSEETITELLMLALRRTHPSAVSIQQFNRVQEGKNGADWAWWFQGPKWLGMRVQAKRLDARMRRYKSLGQLVGKSKTKRQVDLLISEARRENLFPLYCFYRGCPGRC